MCGLTGILCGATTKTSDVAEVVHRMTNRLLHRGPDAEGIWSEDCVALGHRRLSILDLSDAGAQPMHSRCHRYVIAYNGEVYNHSEMRRDLEREGEPPRLSRRGVGSKVRRLCLCCLGLHRSSPQRSWG